MKRAFLLFLTTIFLHSFAFAQSQANTSPSCPAVSVVGPPGTVHPGDDIDFRVIISKDFDTSNLKYFWTVINGTVTKGQETSTVIVKQTDCEKSTTVIVKILGLPESCPDTASETFIISHCKPYRSWILDEYEKMVIEDEKSRLNKVAIELKNEPVSRAFITKSFTSKISKVDAYQNLQRTLNYLQSHGINKNRIIFGATYDKEELTRIFIVPAGADFPLFDDEILDAAQLAEKLKAVKSKSQKKPIKKKSHFISH